MGKHLLPTRLKNDGTPNKRHEEPVSNSTYNQRLAIVSSWYTFVQDVYHLDISNPIKDVQKRKVQAYAAALPIEPDVVETGVKGRMMELPFASERNNGQPMHSSLMQLSQQRSMSISMKCRSPW